MAQMAAILLLTFLVRSISGSPINGKCFTTRYRKKMQCKRELDSLNMINAFFFETRIVSEHLLSQAKHFILQGLLIKVNLMSLKTI